MVETVVISDSYNLEPGMELADDLFNNQGYLILKKGTVLESKIIDRLIELDVRDIVILKDRGNSDPVNHQAKLFQESYQQQTALVEERIKGMLEGGQINAEELFKISQDIISNLKNHNDIFKYISKLDSTYSEAYIHGLNVALICHLFAVWLDFDEEKTQELVTAGLLHDLGKILPGGEKENHTVLGSKFLAERGASKDIQMGVLMHHEKEDGSGFPFKATGSAIHYYAKIISIANHYDNVTTGGKTLQGKICPFDLIRTFENDRYGNFDIKYIDVFLRKIANYYVGESIRLTDGRTGKIIFINEHCLSKPIVQIGETVIDLYSQKDLHIEEVI